MGKRAIGAVLIALGIGLLPVATTAMGQNSRSLTDASSIYGAPQSTSEAQVVSVTRGFPTLSNRAIATSEDTKPTDAAESGLATPTVTVCSSLAVVLGLFAAFVWLTRRFGVGGASQGALSKDVFETLGSTAIDSRTKVTLLRCGNRILITAQTAGGIQPLSEITDPTEVQKLTAACNGHSKNSFAATLSELEQAPVAPGFVHSDTATVTSSDTPRSRGRLFANA
ncbi:FliO/MopB family protein [Novipirellula artificiosorum]|uniref:Flagellar biosynthesis protein, FliO n=1 Tax=Novipirellula artificiosorum TaxID=2528016 RepID=A0A5C6D401_9BACT|nr:flagellar biosynthetic protein FliO [Novipirellula artificiosorum]TWU31540.1 Flagellar biosynthesis protein, FliO [Novipirellula artificiosorum]